MLRGDSESWPTTLSPGTGGLNSRNGCGIIAAKGPIQDHRSRWDERQWRRQSIARVSSVGFSTQSTRMQAQCPSGNTSPYCAPSLREGPRNDRPRQSQALDITKALECTSLVSGLQHFHNLGSPATFPPTECQMAAASYLCVRPWNGIGAARDPGPLLDASCGDRGLVRSPVPSLNSLSMGPGTVDCHCPQSGVKSIKLAKDGGVPAKASSRHGTASGTSINCQQSVRCQQSSDDRQRL